MKRISVAPELVEGTQVEQKAILLYSFASTLYKAPFIINYTPEKLSKKIGLSIVTTRKYIAILVKLGFVERRGPHLAFISKRNFVWDVKKTKFLWINRPRNFYDFIDNYYTALIEQNIEQQHFIIEGKLANPKVRTEVKRIALYKKNYAPKYERKRQSTINDEILLSARSLAKTFKASKTTSNRIINKLAKKGLITQKFKFEEISYFKYKDIKGDDYSKLYCFKQSNRFYIHKGREIKIIE